MDLAGSDFSKLLHKSCILVKDTDTYNNVKTSYNHGIVSDDHSHAGHTVELFLV